MRRAAGSIWLAFLAACAGVERAPDWHEHTPPPPGAFAAPGPFDAMDPAGIWGVGDRVVYAIDVDAAGTHERFTFTLETRRLPEAREDLLVAADPVHGRILTRTADEYWWLGVLHSGDGEATLHAELRGDDGTSCGGDVVARTLAFWTAEDVGIAMDEGLYEMFRALLQLDCLHAALLRVVRAPSAWSIARRFGTIALSYEWPILQGLPVTQQETPFGRLPTVWHPITITANGEPALDGRIQFTHKHPPLLPSTGVLQIEAWHPDDATRRLTIRLASAQRGTPPDSPDPLDLAYGVRRGMTVEEMCRTLRGSVKKVLERGALADGRTVELVELDVPHMLWVSVVHDGRVEYAAMVEEYVRQFLAERGFVPEVLPGR